MVLAAALAPVAVVFPERERWFLLGAWTAGTFGVLMHFVVVASGSARLVMADQGEQWTRQETVPLRKRGWKVVHRVLFRTYGDIDTIAIGSAGVVVIETKWSSEDWTSPTQRRWIEAAVRQAADNAALVDQQIRQRIGASRTWPVVVLWPSAPALPVHDIHGVTVLPGLKLQQWIDALPPGVLEPERVVDAWRFLEKHLAERDAKDYQRRGPGPRSAGQYMIDLLQYPFGAALGLLSVSGTIKATGWPLAIVPSGLLAVVAIWPQRIRWLRRSALAFQLLIASELVALVALTAAEAVTG